MYDKICDKLDGIIEDMSRKEKLTASDLQILDWATHAKKSMMATEEMGGGYSGDYSYARGRNNRRDSMGRYSRDYSRESRNYSGRREYIDGLHAMAADAPDEKTRQSIQRMIREMED